LKSLEILTKHYKKKNTVIKHRCMFDKKDL